MHVSKIKIEGIRSVESFEILLGDSELAGWHVILGDNGSGKSSVIRSLALALIGPSEAAALRQDWRNWLRRGRDSASIELTVHADSQERDNWSSKGKISTKPISARVDFAASPAATVELGPSNTSIAFSSASGTADRTIWGTGLGWFSSSFGPFRRFTGGDPDYLRVFMSNRKAAAHLSAFGENVALTEALQWLKSFHVKSLEGSQLHGNIRDAIKNFVNNSGLLPHGTRIESITSETIQVLDGEGCEVPIEQLSDGYRSILSMTFELLRQMFLTFDPEAVLKSINQINGTISLPGVVAIDEVDAHLHPAWQKRIGQWFVERFPEIQFFVTTHSPIICQAAVKGSVWRLPAPGSTETTGRVEGDELNRLLYGNILDAYGTQFFGIGVTSSDLSKDKRRQLAELNRRSLKGALSAGDKALLQELRAMLPSKAANVAAE